MRKFEFKGKHFNWNTFREEYNPKVFYGKHSFFIVDPQLVKERTGLVLPKGYGVKVFKNKEWQNTAIKDAAFIKNIFWINGLSSRVREIIKFNTKKSGSHLAFIEKIIKGNQTTNSKELIRVAKENHIAINFGSQNEELSNLGNWKVKKYLDFGGFEIDRKLYKKSLIERINQVTHYGHRVADKVISYQAIPAWEVDGKRKTSYRIDKLELIDINFKGKTVIDIGCNLGIMLDYAKKRGAKTLTGYDLPKVIKIAREFANFNRNIDIDFFARNLKENPPKRKADIVFFLAMSEYLGFPQWLSDMTGKICIYEGHAKDTIEETKANLKKLFPRVESLGMSEDRSIRPLFICYKS